MIHKTQHLIKSFRKLLIIIYTDYFTAISIFKQTSLSLSFTDKLNLWLVYASQYLSQFNILIKHKAERSNIVLDTLFRLREVFPSDNPIIDTLDALCAVIWEGASHYLVILVFYIMLIEITDKFKVRLQTTYKNDSQ